MESENLLLSQENQSPPPDPSKTLGGQILDQEMGIECESALSPWSDVTSADASEFDSFDEPKGCETEENDQLLNCIPRNLISRFDSQWSSQNHSIARIGAGLSNLGNTCFLNAVLQCFMHTVPLLEGIFSDKMSCNCNNEKFCILCSLRELVELSLTSTNKIVSPWKLVDNLNYFSSGFLRSQQEDAHEFLQCFLDRLENFDARSEDTGSSSNNIVKQVFGGRLVSKLKCCNCGHCSDTYEPSIDLSLEIVDADSLLTALKSFTKLEKIGDSDTKFTCEECKKQVSVEKQLVFDQNPSVAAFHLKRFKNDGCIVQKIDKHVAFPIELDLLPFATSCKTNNAEYLYVLYAVVVHTGSTSTSGHYYCFVRISPDVWFKFDDSRVIQVSEDFVLSQEAYILFYARDGTSWFSNFIETKKLFLEESMLNTSPKSVLENACTSSFSPAMPKRITCESNEAKCGAGLTHDVVGRNDVEDNEPKLKKLVSNESKDNSHRAPISVATFSSDSLCTLVNKTQKDLSPSLHENVKLRKEVAGIRIITPQTPPRSPSPEIYREDPSDAGFFIPREHLKLVGSSCKRRLDKDIDDLETKQACSFIKKSIPGSRGQQLLAALRGSSSEGSHRKKPRSLGLPQRRDDSSAPRHVFRPLVASGSR